MAEIKDGNIITNECKLNYVYVDKPHVSQNKDFKDRYETCVLIPKSDTQTVELIKQECKRVCDNAKNTNWNGLNPTNPRNMTVIYDGDEDADNNIKPNDYRGFYYVNCNTTIKPVIANIYGDEQKEDGFIKNGDYGFVAFYISAYPFKNMQTPGKGLKATLVSIMKTRSGTHQQQQADVKSLFKSVIKPKTQAPSNMPISSETDSDFDF